MRLGLRGSVALPIHADRYTDSKNTLVLRDYRGKFIVAQLCRLAQ